MYEEPLVAERVGARVAAAVDDRPHRDGRLIADRPEPVRLRRVEGDGVVRVDDVLLNPICTPSVPLTTKPNSLPPCRERASGGTGLGADRIDEVDEVDLLVGAGREPLPANAARERDHFTRAVALHRSHEVAAAPGDGSAPLKRSPIGMPSCVATAQSVATEGVARPTLDLRDQARRDLGLGGEAAHRESGGLPRLADARAKRLRDAAAPVAARCLARPPARPVRSRPHDHYSPAFPRVPSTGVKLGRASL